MKRKAGQLPSLEAAIAAFKQSVRGGNGRSKDFIKFVKHISITDPDGFRDYMADIAAHAKANLHLTKKVLEIVITYIPNNPQVANNFNAVLVVLFSPPISSDELVQADLFSFLLQGCYHQDISFVETAFQHPRRSPGIYKALQNYIESHSNSRAVVYFINRVLSHSPLLLKQFLAAHPPFVDVVLKNGSSLLYAAISQIENDSDLGIVEFLIVHKCRYAGEKPFEEIRLPKTLRKAIAGLFADNGYDPISATALGPAAVTKTTASDAPDYGTSSGAGTSASTGIHDDKDVFRIVIFDKTDAFAAELPYQLPRRASSVDIFHAAKFVIAGLKRTDETLHDFKIALKKASDAGICEGMPYFDTALSSNDIYIMLVHRNAVRSFVIARPLRAKVFYVDLICAARRKDMHTPDNDKRFSGEAIMQIATQYAVSRGYDELALQAIPTRATTYKKWGFEFKESCQSRAYCRNAGDGRRATTYAMRLCGIKAEAGTSPPPRVVETFEVFVVFDGNMVLRSELSRLPESPTFKDTALAAEIAIRNLKHINSTAIDFNFVELLHNAIEAGSCRGIDESFLHTAIERNKIWIIILQDKVVRSFILANPSKNLNSLHVDSICASKRDDRFTPNDDKRFSGEMIMQLAIEYAISANFDEVALISIPGRETKYEKWGFEYRYECNAAPYPKARTRRESGGADESYYMLLCGIKRRKAAGFPVHTPEIPKISNTSKQINITAEELSRIEERLQMPKCPPSTDDENWWA